MDQPHPVALVALALMACVPDDGTDTASMPAVSPSGYADVVVRAPGQTGEGFYDANRAINGVRGLGTNQGSADVFSLGLDAQLDGYIELSWSSGRVFDGPGPDLSVFENAFDHSSGRFFDAIVVEVSADGELWVAFEHSYAGGEWTSDPTLWTGFAGLTPVLLNDDTNPVDALDPTVAGGDAFDLANLPPGPDTDTLLSLGVSHVRLTSAGALINPDTGERYPIDPVANGADIDGVFGRLE